MDSLVGFALEYVDSDPNSSIIKQGMILEYIIKVILSLNNLYGRKGNGEYPDLMELIRIADRNGLLPPDQRILDDIHALRRLRNTAVHEFVGDPSKAERHMDLVYSISKWFVKKIGIYRNVYVVGEPYLPYGEQGYEDRWTEDIELPLSMNESVLDYTRRILSELH